MLLKMFSIKDKKSNKSNDYTCDIVIKVIFLLCICTTVVGNDRNTLFMYICICLRYCLVYKLFFFFFICMSYRLVRKLKEKYGKFFSLY